MTLKPNLLTLLALLTILMSTELFAQQSTCNQLQLPIGFDSHGLPTINLKINQEEFNALLDLGSSAGLHLPLRVLENIPGATYTGEMVKSMDIEGDINEEKAFIIPSLSINCLTFTDIAGKELKPWGASIGEDKLEKSEEQAVVGRGFFKGKKISIDYPNKKLTIYSSLDTASSLDSDKQTLPMIMNDEGITLTISSQNTSYRMVLDTGASQSIFVADKVSNKELLKDCSHDLGPGIQCKIMVSPLKIAGYDFQANPLLFPIDKRFKMDGLLGSDFLNQFKIELNFVSGRIKLTPI